MIKPHHQGANFKVNSKLLSNSQTPKAKSETNKSLQKTLPHPERRRRSPKQASHFKKRLPLPNAEGEV
jgi:hypothetical protein